MERNIEEVFEKIGIFGKYQKLNVLLILLSIQICGFTTPFLPLMQIQPLVYFTRKSTDEVVHTRMDYAYCTNPDIEDIHIDTDNNIPNWNSDYGLYCDKLFVGLIGTFYSVGFVFGQMLTLLAWRIGKKNALLLAYLLVIISSGLLFTGNIFLMYFACIMLGMAHSEVTILRGIILAELLPNDLRSIFISISFCSNVSNSLICYAIYTQGIYWKYCYIFLCCAAGVLGLSFSLLTVENPRFYVQRYDIDKCLQSINYIRQFNNIHKAEITKEDLLRTNEQSNETPIATTKLATTDSSLGQTVDGKLNVNLLESQDYENQITAPESPSDELQEKKLIRRSNIHKSIKLGIMFCLVQGMIPLVLQEIRIYESNPAFYVFTVLTMPMLFFSGFLSNKIGRKNTLIILIGVILFCNALKIGLSFFGFPMLNFYLYLIERIHMFLGQPTAVTIISESFNTQIRTKFIAGITLVAFSFAFFFPMIFEFFVHYNDYTVGLLNSGIIITTAVFVSETKGKNLSEIK